jgi:hypothetical protein
MCYRVLPLIPSNRITLAVFAMEPQQLSAWLNRSALPRAIADFQGQYFVSWNAAFLERTGYSEVRIRAIRPEQIIVLSDVRFPLPNGSGLSSAEFVQCAVRTTLQPAALPGHILKASGFGYIMLHGVEPSASVEFEEARLVGQEEERARLVQMFHDEVSPAMLGAIFAVESIKEVMQTQNLPQAETAVRASELLTEAVEKLSDVLEGKSEAKQQSP